MTIANMRRHTKQKHHVPTLLVNKFPTGDRWTNRIYARRGRGRSFHFLVFTRETSDA